MAQPTEKEKSNQKTINGYTNKDIEIRVVKNFLDILILIEMKKQYSISGSDIMNFVNSKFGEVLSPGTVYGTLYSLERKGLIKGESDGRKTVFLLTEQGKEVTCVMLKDFNAIMTDFVRNFLTV